MKGGQGIFFFSAGLLDPSPWLVFFSAATPTDAALAGSAALAGTPLELASTARISVLSGGTVLGAWPCDRWRARLVGELCA